jgi:hypothetical protein
MPDSRHIIDDASGFEWRCRRSRVDGAAFELGVLRDEAQCAYLRIGTNFDADLNDTSETNGDVVAKPDPGRLHDARLHGVARQMDTTPDDHIVAAFNQVVVTHREAVDVHSFAESGAIESQMDGPQRCSADQRTCYDPRKMDGRPVANPPQQRPVHIGHSQVGVWGGAPPEQSHGER